MRRVDLWSFDPSTCDCLEISEIPYVVEDEKSRSLDFKFHIDRHNFLLRRMFCRDVISRYIDCSAVDIEFVNGVNGKPEVKGYDVNFSLSKTHGLVVLAISFDSPLGVDVEIYNKSNKSDLELLGFILADSERKALSSLKQKDRAILRLWTMKEAYVKALGLGLSVDLKSFSFDLDAGGFLTFSEQDDSQDWKSLELDCFDGYFSSLVCEASVSNVKLFDWTLNGNNEGRELVV